MRPRGKNNKCAIAWKKWEAGYAKKKGGKEEAARERREFYCDKGKIKLRPSTDADVPLTDKQMGASAAEPRKTIGKGKNFNKANPTGTGAKAGGGMTQKGVNEYKSKNPGSKLKTAVTKDPSKLKPGSKDAKRRKSFCARSKSWDGERGRAARRRWNC
jgi:hypothetical protein